jgi:hypothetical protein
MKNKLLISLLVLGLIIAIGFYFLVIKTERVEAPTNGQIETETPIEHPLIRLETPQPNEVITSPLRVTGEAVGNWFFEASFPVQLFDANYKEIPLSPSYIMATDDWMTTEFVPFTGNLNFTKPETAEGILILKKDNPSGLPEHDDEVVIPIKF